MYETQHHEPQAQYVLRQILLKLGGLERSVARQGVTLKAVQGDVKAVQAMLRK